VASATKDALSWAYGDDFTGAICAGVANGSPVKDGLWDLAVFLGGAAEPSFTTSVFVGGSHPLSTVTIWASGDEVCEIHLVPKHASGWQQNLLDQRLASEGAVDLQVPAGTYRLRAVDCAGSVLDERGSLSLEEGTDITLDG